MYDSTTSPITSRAVYSGGQSDANDASVGARNISAITDSVPATNEPIAAIMSAGHARARHRVAVDAVITEAASRDAHRD